MKKFSFFVNNLGPNQISYLLSRNIPDFIRNNPGTDICVFYETIFQHCYVNNFGIFPNGELWGYDSPCISIGFEIGEKLLLIPTVKKKFHFVFDFDWSLDVYNSDRIRQFYKNPNLKFLVRTEEHGKIFKDRWNRDYEVVGDLDVRKISEII